MPNTLAHMGVQSVITRRLVTNADPKWIYIGCLVPDVPWIVQRVAMAVAPGIDPYALRLYCIVQASLLFSLVLCLAFAVLSRRPWHLFAILATGSVLHLLLDSLETKWANGVHFWAPFDWDLLNFGLFWPESLPVLALSVFGIGYCALFWRTALMQAAETQLLSARRVASAGAIITVYAAMPLLLLDGPTGADNHFVRTLREVDARTGRDVELDRATYIPSASGGLLRTFAGEAIRADGLDLEDGATVSIRGRFLAADRMQVIAWHRHPKGFRDYLNYLGIFLIVTLWLWHAALARRSGGPPFSGSGREFA